MKRQPELRSPHHPWSDPEAAGMPRDAKGRYGGNQGGRHFPLSQGEYWQASGRLADGFALFGIIELETGEWLADGWYDSPRYLDRATALRAAVEAMARRIVAAVIGGPVNGRWLPAAGLPLPRARAEAIIAWGCEIAGIPPIPIPGRHPVQPVPVPPPPPPQGVLL